MTDVEFGDPPGKQRKQYRWHEVAARLRANPGEWAKVAVNIDRSLATYVKNGRLAAFRPVGAYEATTRKQDGDEGRNATLYVRYVGTR